MSEMDDTPPTRESNDSGASESTKQEDEAPSPDKPTEEEEDDEEVDEAEDTRDLVGQSERGELGEEESDDEHTAPPLTEDDEEEAPDDAHVEDAGTGGAGAEDEGKDDEGAEGSADTGDAEDTDSSEDMKVEDEEAGDGEDGGGEDEGGEHPFSPDLERHVFKVEINANGDPVGYHHREGGVDEGDFTVDDSTKSPVDQHGVYEADWTATAPDGTEMTKNSSFFPDSYSREDVRDAVREAFDNRTSPSANNPRLWEGTTSDGMTIQGYVEPGTTVADATEDNIKTAFPVWQGRFLL